MTLNKEFANIYLVTGIIAALVIFSTITFIIIEDNISSGSSVQMLKERIQKNN
jgi:hypothetical protein